MNTLYTWGYGGNSLVDLKEQLGDITTRIETITVVDIRFSPYSRMPQWAWEEIQKGLVPVRYCWSKGLGNPNYKRGPMTLHDPEKATLRIAKYLQEGPVVLLCSCRNVEQCHRKMAAEELAKRLGCNIVHLPPRKVMQVSGIPRTVKVLSLHQPWASLIAWGEKTIETRDWSTSYRGWLAIHATKDMPKYAVDYCVDCEPIFKAMVRHKATIDSLPKGAIVAVGRLAKSEVIIQQTIPAEPERSFGNFQVGRYAWHLADVHALPQPIATRGARGMWDFDLVGALSEQSGEQADRLKEVLSV